MLNQKRARRNIELKAAYAGARFAGWQIQPHVRTVQGLIAGLLRRLLNEPELKTTGASRTDAGVHAHDQRIGFFTANPIPLEGLRRALNHLLPPDVRILSARERPLGFSVRHSALGKHYAYFIHNRPDPSPFIADCVWCWEPPLDAAAMHEAAAVFVGERCFRALQSRRDRRDVSRVEIHAARVARLGDVVCFEVIGRRFLYHMVRNMIGALIPVGRGEWSPADLRANLESGDRERMGVTAPASGLHLFRVFYEPPPFEYAPESGRFLRHLASESP